MRWTIPSAWKARLPNTSLSRALDAVPSSPNKSVSQRCYHTSFFSCKGQIKWTENAANKRIRDRDVITSSRQKRYLTTLESPGGHKVCIQRAYSSIPSVQLTREGVLLGGAEGESIAPKSIAENTCKRSFSSGATHSFTRRLLKNVIKRVAGDTLQFSPSKRADEHPRFGLNEDLPSKNEEGSNIHKFHSGVNQSKAKTETGEPSLIDTPVLEIPSPLSVDDFLLNHLSPCSVDTLNLEAFTDLDEVDPFKLTEGEISNISENIQGLLGVDHPVLSTVSHYFFKIDGGKKLRPTMVVLMSQAMNHHRRVEERKMESLSKQDNPVNGVGEQMLDEDTLFKSQIRLAEITELLHTASLLHDDVIDVADTRRGVSSVNSVFGNKLAILAGDFLLARASVCVARLRNIPVIELLSTVIEHLVKGEVMQLKNALRNTKAVDSAFEIYLRKTFYKTGSLMANSCKSAALLGEHSDHVADVGYRYGQHLGLAFQLVDDMLDFTGQSSYLGKPSLNDMKQGIATAPILFASEQYPDVMKLIERKFEASGDVEKGARLVEKSDGVERTRKLAFAHTQQALDAIAELHPSKYRTALAALACELMDRTK